MTLTKETFGELGVVSIVIRITAWSYLRLKIEFLRRFISGKTMTELSLTEWISNALYSELCQMPLWTVSAFGSLQDGDVLKPDDVRYQLINYLIGNHQRNAPPSVGPYDGHKISDFIPCIKAAVNTSRSCLRL